jgi:alcohol dehydrogenase class IV
MVSSFEFTTATRIVFGPGKASELAGAAKSMGSRALLVTGSRSSAWEEGRAVLRIAGEPAVDQIRDGVSYARDQECDVVIAIGGGSVIDAGKAIAALLTNGSEPLDYLEVVGKGLPLQNRSAPFILNPAVR